MKSNVFAGKAANDAPGMPLDSTAKEVFAVEGSPKTVERVLSVLFGVTTYTYFFYVFTIMVMFIENATRNFSSLMSTTVVPVSSWLGQTLNVAGDVQLSALFPHTVDYQVLIRT